MTPRFTALKSTLFRKSHRDLNAPLFSRALSMDSTADSPALATAFSPNRITLPTAEKLAPDSFTSGGSTCVPEFLTSRTYRARTSILDPIWLDRNAAKNSAL